MFPISVYFGGHFEYGPMGATYSKGTDLCFSSHGIVTLHQLKEKIYKHRGLLESQFTLNINARYNLTHSGTIYFTVMPVREDRAWSFIIQSVASGSNLRIVELLVDFIPHYTSSGFVPTPSSLPRRNNISHQNMPKDPNQYMPRQKIPSNASDSFPAQNQMNANLESNSNLSNELGDIISVASLSDDEYIQNDASEDELSGDEFGAEIEEQKEEEKDKYNAEDSSNDEGEVVEWESCVTYVSSAVPPKSYLLDFDFSTDEDVGYPFVLNKKFRSKQDLEHTIRKFHILQNRHIVVVNSCRTAYKVRCDNEMCTWDLYAKEDCCGKWFIRNCPDPHTCRASSSRDEHKLLTDSFIAEEIFQAVWRNSAIGIKELSSIIEMKYEIVPSRTKLWRAKEMGIEWEFGSWTEAYASLPVLLQAMQATNPGTKFEIQSDQTQKLGVQLFKRAVWAFGPAIEGFRYLRPVIGIDSICLSGKFMGKIILACGFDAEYQLFPLAFAVVDGEDNSNWIWFMKWLRHEVVGSDRTLCVISDQDPFISDVFKRDDCGWCEDKGEAVHRYCSRHISEHIDMHFKDAQLVAAFDWAVKQKEKHKFEEGLKKIENMDKIAYNWLIDIGKKNPKDPKEEPRFDLWTQCEDAGFRWGIMTTTGAEELKKFFIEACQVPINGIAKKTFYKTLEYFADRREHARILAAGSTWSSHIKEKLDKREQKAGMYEVKLIDLAQGTYDVSLKEEKVEGQSSDAAKYGVTIFSEKVAKCTCQKPSLTSIPCVHVLAVCGYRRLQRDNFVSHVYSAEALLNTWSPQFHHYGNSDEWPSYEGPTIVPDETKVNRGRMKEFTRQMDMDELQ